MTKKTSIGGKLYTALVFIFLYAPIAVLILFSFILQAVSYEFRSKPGNIFGTRTYDVFLFINGCVGCVLLGVAVAMMFFGGEFIVSKASILDVQAPVISVWGPDHGIEAIFQWRNLLLGFTVFFLARTLASLYFIKNVAHDERFLKRQRRSVLINGSIFTVLFLVFAYVLLTASGVESTADGMRWVEYKYFTNFIDLWWIGVIFLIGVVLVLWGIIATVVLPAYTRGIIPAGLGTALVVICLICIAGYNNTAYYPSIEDVNSSLTIANSSSSLFTLKVMSCVSVIIPFVLAYIAYVWRKMDAKPITPEEMNADSHKY